MSTNFVKVTSMNFMNYDLLFTASQRHHELAKHAADFRLVRRSPRRRRSEGRPLSPPRGRPDSA